MPTKIEWAEETWNPITGLIVDLFAGGGGASAGIRAALGRDPDVAINHDRVALAMHMANHPGTWHLRQNIRDVSPRWATRRRPVDLLWASPDCKHFSKAKGAAPTRSREIRSLAWVAERWARDVRPRVIILENVEEFKTWGPLDSDGRIVKSQKGSTYREFLRCLRRIGYRVEDRELRACDYGAPTIRKRLFLIARSDGEQIVWPDPTHGPGLIPYRTAADIIDWSIPCPSIFDRKKPLVENTLRRIAEGIRRFVIEAAEPFIVTYYGPKDGEQFRGRGIHDTLPTQTTENRFGLVTPFAVPLTHHGDRRTYGMDRPMPTVTAGGWHVAEVRAFLLKYYGTSQDPRLSDPMHTVTTKHRFGLVTVDIAREPYVIADIGMRMLSPRELFRAQGFDDSYRIDIEVDGRRITKSDQVRCCGNSVCPPIAAALVGANMQEVLLDRRMEAPVCTNG